MPPLRYSIKIILDGCCDHRGNTVRGAVKVCLGQRQWGMTRDDAERC